MTLEQTESRQKDPRRVTKISQIEKESTLLLVSVDANGEVSQMAVIVKDEPRLVKIRHRTEHFVTLEINDQEKRTMVLPLSNLGVGRDAHQGPNLRRWLEHPDGLSQSS
jgi:hypothetical protein